MYDFLSQKSKISSFDELKGLDSIPEGTVIQEWREDVLVTWTNNIDPALSKGIDFSKWYMVSDKGDTYSIYTHMAMRCYPNRKNGYYYVSFQRAWLNGKKAIHVYISRLVLRTFTRPELLPENWQQLDAAHKDDNPANNRIDNLEFLTHVQNCNAPHFRAAMSAVWKRHNQRE